MGTSNWQNISYCVEILREFEPKSILDIGIGFGRWGILTREFLDVWYGRDNPKTWQIWVEGIEAYESAISGYHHAFYNRIHIGDAFDILPEMGEFDLVILGDVLEHFSPDRASRVLERCKEIGRLVMVVIPLGRDWHQKEKYGNPYERHLSVWIDEQLTTPDLLRKRMFKDFSERPFGVYVYRGSKNPPKGEKSKDANELHESAEQAARDLYRYLLRHPKRTKLLRDMLYFLHKWLPRKLR